MPLEPEFAESSRFFTRGIKAFNLISTFCDDNPSFTIMLSGAQANFNPIAAYYKNRRKAFEMAATGVAEATLSETAPVGHLRKSGVWKRHAPFEPPASPTPQYLRPARSH